MNLHIVYLRIIDVVPLVKPGGMPAKREAGPYAPEAGSKRQA